MAKSEAEYIAFLDCDDLWLPQKLEKQISLMDNDPEVALAFSDAVYFNENGDLCQIYLKFKPPRGKIFRELFRKLFFMHGLSCPAKIGPPGLSLV